MYILPFYVTFFLAYLIFYLAFFLAYTMTFYLTYFLAYILTFFLAFYSGIHSGILSVWHCIRHSVRHSIWHSLWQVFGSRRDLWHDAAKQLWILNIFESLSTKPMDDPHSALVATVLQLCFPGCKFLTDVPARQRRTCISWSWDRHVYLPIPKSSSADAKQWCLSNR